MSSGFPRTLSEGRGTQECRAPCKPPFLNTRRVATLPRGFAHSIIVQHPSEKRKQSWVRVQRRPCSSSTWTGKALCLLPQKPGLFSRGKSGNRPSADARIPGGSIPVCDLFTPNSVRCARSLPNTPTNRPTNQNHPHYLQTHLFPYITS